VAARAFLARILWLQGFADQAMRTADSNVREARAIGHALSLCYALEAAAAVALFAGDLGTAERFMATLLSDAEKHGFGAWHAQRRGPITKAGHSRTRWLLIQAAVSILRRHPPQAEELRTWALRIATRRGKQIAVVALARRLAGILYALLRDGSVFEPQHVRPPRPTAAALVNA